MSGAVLASSLPVGLLGLVGSRWIPLPVTIVLVVVAAVVAAAVVQARETRRVRQLVEEIGDWVGADQHRSVSLQGSPPWRQLGVVLNALGAAYHRRGARLLHEQPWRRELVDSLLEPALLFSQEGRLLAANDGARSLLGIPVDATDVTVLQAVGSAALAASVRRAREQDQPLIVDVEHGNRDLRAAVSVVGEETLLIIADRTRERQVEELRRNFVVNASHELKTPVTSIQTLAEALVVTLRTDPDRAQSLAVQLGVEADRLARLVRELLDLRRLEERGPIEREPVNLAELVRLSAAELIPRAEARQITLDVDAPDRVMVAGVLGDLEVIVKNLIVNALQYNRPQGAVTIEVKRQGEMVVLRVTDTGIGIPQQDLSRIFERFYRVDAARSRVTGGTGLGLSIVRHAVDRHGGMVEVDSLLGEGTTFTVRLPAEAPSH